MGLLGTKKVKEFLYFIMEKSWNLKVQKEHEPFIGSLSSEDHIQSGWCNSKFRKDLLKNLILFSHM